MNHDKLLTIPTVHRLLLNWSLSVHQFNRRIVLGCQCRQCGRGLVCVSLSESSDWMWVCVRLSESLVWTWDCVSLSQNREAWSGARTNTYSRHHLLRRSRSVGCSFGKAGQGSVAEVWRAYPSSSPDVQHRQGWRPGSLTRTGPVNRSGYV